MKCPKCGYLGFEDVRRCRNCGYDFSLTSASPTPDLPLRRDDNTPSPLDDLALIDAAAAPLPPRMTDVGADVHRAPGLQAAATAGSRFAATGGSRAPTPSREGGEVELPLFGPPIPDDEPLIKRASPPRAPLAVRRSTPDVPRARAETPRAPAIDLTLESDVVVAPAPTVAARPEVTVWSEDDDAQDAPVAARVIAVAIDLAILAVIDAVVVYFTAQICGITLADLNVLPKGPLVAFLFVQNGGYLVAFTAGGQTLGKMAAGIRVVASESTAPLDLGRAFLRTVMWVLLAIPAGLGFFSAIVSRNHRGLHDRFAGTRVVRA
ncbi:MAG TPA: RDD family protein [Vicinamibacterales bacterium]|nr:RDD family protein [Vicinamibacterales bacterium]